MIQFIVLLLPSAPCRQQGEMFLSLRCGGPCDLRALLCSPTVGALGPRYPSIHNTLSVGPPVSSDLLKRLLAMYVNVVNLWPRGSLLALFTLPMCHLDACDI